ncbi:Peroxisome biogenesis protein 22 [Platanthera guangdongensis]|uniref:Peroxisome biogenesis protein 22 n=1 Tax=Platanthera guangdongensis TaxID=2320717 RepID=A0ABR2LG78_9ASPA
MVASLFSATNEVAIHLRFGFYPEEESCTENEQIVTRSSSSVSEGSYEFSRMSAGGSSLATSSPSQRSMSTFHFPSLLASVYEMTCQLLCVILEEKSPEELQKHATVRHSVVEILVEIANCRDFYLMERVLDDESEVRQ